MTKYLTLLFPFLSVLSVTVGQDLPHIILIIADDLGFNDVGFHGSPQIPTPNLDSLAYSGVILNNYYVSPICTPSRSALFTGKHPIHTGMQHNVIYGTTPFGLPLEEKLLPEYLKELNYSTHLVGKWHLGHFRSSYTPTRRGFDSHFGHWTGHKDYYDNMAEENNPEAWGYDTRRNLEVSYDHWGNYTTDVYTEEAIAIIEGHRKSGEKSTPLFLTISHTAVHSANPYKLLQAPYDVEKSFAHISDRNRRTYAAMVAKLDESVGKVVQVLSKEDMLRNSIVIFTTDNGGPAAGFNGNAASNWPLRGVKNTLYEGGVRGVGFIWSPLIKASSRVSTQLMHIQDWVPTLLAAVGLDPDDDTSLDGLNLWDTINDPNATSPRTELLHNIDDDYGNEAVRYGEWKLMHGTTYGGTWDNWYGPSGLEPEEAEATNDTARSSLPHTMFQAVIDSQAGKAIRELWSNKTILNPSEMETMQREAQVVCNSHKERTKKKKQLVSCNLSTGQYCLFNIKNDPCEYINLADSMPEMVTKLKDLLVQYRKTAVTPRNEAKDPRGQPKYWNYTWTNWMDYV